ncbi:MAG: FtsB family cell division protein [Streptosporangiaceae bacterium]|jgi:cell division protein FtsL
MPQSPGGGRLSSRLRPRFTTRAAVLAVVLCAIALSLAYPVREYISERRQIGLLEVQQQLLTSQLRKLNAERRALSTSQYVEQQAENRLHMCMPSKICYVIIGGSKAAAGHAAGPVVAPWYQRLWSSVQQADKVSAR